MPASISTSSNAEMAKPPFVAVAVGRTRDATGESGACLGAEGRVGGERDGSVRRLAIDVALHSRLIEIGLGLGARLCLDAGAASRQQIPAPLQHVNITGIGLGRDLAALVGVIALLDILLLLLEFGLDVLDPRSDLDVAGPRR